MRRSSAASPSRPERAAVPTSFTGIRVASVLMLAVVTLLLPDRLDFRAFVWSFAIAHYAIALLYSGPTLRAVYENRPAWPWVGGLLALGALAFVGGVTIEFYFGLHHALNESFMLDRVTQQRGDPRVRRLRGAGVALHIAIFICLTGTSFTRYFEPTWLWGIVATSAWFGVALWQARPVLSRRELADHVAFKAIVVPLVVWGVAAGHQLSVLDVALYHFMFWAFFPALGLVRRGARVGGYALLTVAAIGGLVLVSPMGLIEPHFGRGSFRAAFVLVSFFHITVSVALSNANPDRVNRFFRPSQAAAV